MDGGNSVRTGSLSPLTVRLLVKGRIVIQDPLKSLPAEAFTEI